MENSLNQNSKSKIYDFSHHWIIPVLHATLLYGEQHYTSLKKQVMFLVLPMTKK